MIAVSEVFGVGQGPILLDELQCIGNERSLLSCTHSGVNTHDCTHAKDAGIICAFGNWHSHTYIIHMYKSHIHVCTCVYEHAHKTHMQ